MGSVSSCACACIRGRAGVAGAWHVGSGGGGVVHALRAAVYGRKKGGGGEGSGSVQMRARAAGGEGGKKPAAVAVAARGKRVARDGMGCETVAMAGGMCAQQGTAAWRRGCEVWSAERRGGMGERTVERGSV